MDRAFEEEGGVIFVEATSDVARNLQQNKNARQRMQTKKQKDEFQDLLSYAAENGVKGLQWTPAPRVVFVKKGPNATGVFSLTQLITLGISTSLPPVTKIECSFMNRLEELLNFQDQQSFM